MSHPFSPSFLKNKKVGFLGAGHMGQSLIKALVESQTVQPQQIFACDLSEAKLKKLSEQLGIQTRNLAEKVIDEADIVFLAVKPQDLTGVLEPLASIFRPDQVVISIAAGFSLESLRKLLPHVTGIIRVMPNTPVSVRRAVFGYCTDEKGQIFQELVETLLRPLGIVVPVAEGDEFVALTVSAGSGTGFVFELMQYWQEWLEEHDFEPDVARQMVVQTFLGAGELAAANPDQSISELQDQVVSKKGVTAAGLDSMRELEVERALRYSFEKAVLRDQEIARGTAKQ